MSDLSPPGEPGYQPDKWFQHVVNVGLREARDVGLGLSLFNALRRRFQGVAQAILGAAATVIGQGVRAAAEWMQGGPEYIPDLADLPVAPRASFGGAETDRIVALWTQSYVTKTGSGRAEWALRTTVPEGWTKEEIQDAMDAQAEEFEPKYDIQAEIEDRQNQQIMFWMAKRF